MPKLKERSSDDKIKRPGKDRKPKGPLRQITAKFRRRLVERQRDNCPACKSNFPHGN